MITDVTQVQVMQALLGAIQTIVDDHTPYALQVEVPGHCSVDKAQQYDPYLQIEVKFLAADQADLGTDPLVKQWGQLWVSAVTKEGKGWLEPMALLDFVRRRLEVKRIGPVVTLAAGGLLQKDVKGEKHWPMILNFYYHRQT